MTKKLLIDLSAKLRVSEQDERNILLNTDIFSEGISSYLLDLKLNNLDYSKNLIESILSKIKNTSIIDEKTALFDIIAGIYYLYPNFFSNLSKEDLELIRNPIKRLSYLCGQDIQNEDFIHNFNFSFDDYQSQMDKYDLFENCFPFFMIYPSSEGWLIQTLRHDTFSNYIIEDTTLTYRGHGHTRKNPKIVIRSFIIEQVKKMRLKL